MSPSPVLIVWLFAAIVMAMIIALPDIGHACTFDLFDSPADRLRQQVRAADAIVLGVVASERSEPSANAERLRYVSTIRLEEILAGRVPAELAVDWLGYVHWDVACVGGPRLIEGEQVLLFLERVGTDVASVGGMWTVTLAGQGAYVLEDGEAYYRPPLEGEPEHVGSQRALIEEVRGLTAGFPKTSRPLAREPAVIAAALLVLAAAFLLVRYLRREPS